MSSGLIMKLDSVLFSIVDQGEANTYLCLSDEPNWLMSIRMNGELLVHQQQKICKRIEFVLQHGDKLVLNETELKIQSTREKISMLNSLLENFSKRSKHKAAIEIDRKLSILYKELDKLTEIYAIELDTPENFDK